MDSLRLQENSWQDVANYLKSDDRIIIPVGSTEQHGAFAPLGTDTFVATAIAEAAAEKTGVLNAPPLWFGWSPHHLVKPGTISIRAEVLIEVLFDAIKSLADNGFKNFVVINGHRIVNISWMQIAAERSQRELDVKVVIFDPAYMSKEIVQKLGFGPIGHAEEIEISHMLHIHPDLVRIEEASDNPHEEKPLYHLDPHDPRDTLCYVPATREDLQKVFDASGDTVGGRPTQSSSEDGRRYHEHLVKRLTEVLGLLKP
jgi:creatinine amidohydrolase